MITLQDSGYTAELLPERGGNCVRLSRYGIEALRSPEKLSDFETQNPYLFGMPLLFPPNRISEGRFEFDGRVYEFPVNEPDTGCFLHGTLHQTPFEVLESKAKTAVLSYRATDAAPYLCFPHAFTLMLIYELGADGLHQQTVFTNDSGTKMPVALAFHTTFRLPLPLGSNADDVRLCLDTSMEFSRNMQNYLPDGQTDEWHPFRKDMESGTFAPACHTLSRLYAMGKTHEMTLSNGDARIRYRAGSHFGYWMVYNGGSRECLCVEPQSWLSNCPNAPFPREETGFDYLLPGESRVYETWLSIEEPLERT